MSVTSELLSTLCALDAERKELKRRLDHLNDERAAIEEQILTLWEHEGTTRQTVDGVTIYLSSRTWWKPQDSRHRVVAALEALGLHDIVTFNTQTLSSYCNELVREGGTIPPVLAETVQASETFQIKTRGQ